MAAVCASRNSWWETEQNEISSRISFFIFSFSESSSHSDIALEFLLIVFSEFLHRNNVYIPYFNIYSRRPYCTRHSEEMGKQVSPVRK